jgi:integrase
MTDAPDLTFNVHISKKLEVYRGKRKTTYTVRWRVDKQPFRKTHDTFGLADSFRSELVSAAKRGEGFHRVEGLPVSMLRTEQPTQSWYAFARSYVDAKWPRMSAHHRKDTSWVLMNATMALLTGRRRPPTATLRTALFRWAYNPPTWKNSTPPDDVQEALDWLESNTVQVGDLAQDSVIAAAVKAVTTGVDGQRLAFTSRKRNHGILKTAIDQAVVAGLLKANPVGDFEGVQGRTVHQVDRRCVVNPAQARRLLDAVRAYGHASERNGDRHQSGPRMVAYFGSMYYSALRPEEAVNLRRADLEFPEPERVRNDAGLEEVKFGWGWIHVHEATPEVGKAWTDSGESRDRRGLKHREEDEVRAVPCPPELTRLLWEHLERFGTDDDGRLFVGVRGRPLADITCNRAWQAARRAALTPLEVDSPLAGTQYALRHTCVSTWLNAGVSETLVARWAGHSVAVLKRVYAKCLVGEEERAKEQIDTALSR